MRFHLFVLVIQDILAHEIPHDLSGGPVLRATHLNKLVSEVALYANAKSFPDMRKSVSIVSTPAKSPTRVIHNFFR